MHWCAASLLALRPLGADASKKIKILGGIHGFARSGDHHLQGSLVVVPAHRGGTIALRAYLRDD
jgi:hypothetical protein